MAIDVRLWDKEAGDNETNHQMQVDEMEFD
jgi:hypothetical protein